jgi:ABC-2 type transport system ATP-binding protein
MGDGPAADLAVEVEELSIDFHGVKALDAIDLRVSRGEIFGIVGTNGAGKSTLIDALSGLVRPTSGSIRIMGMDPIRRSGELRKMVGVVPQEISLEEKLTGMENLQYFGRLLDVPGDQLQERAEEIIRFMGLWERRDDSLESYSVGMKRKIHFACSLIHRPKLLLVDEATAGFDPTIKTEVSQLIMDMSRKEGITVVLTTHDLSDARSLCDRLAVLHRGSVVSTGSWDEISSVSGAKLILGGVSPGDEESLREAVPPESLSKKQGGFEVKVESLSEALEIAGNLQRRGIGVSIVSYEIPAEEVFRELTRDRGGEISEA